MLDNSKDLKIIIVGDVGVGKTCIIYYYLKDKFNSEVTSTVSLSPSEYTKVINNKKFNLHIFDTAGQERYFSLTKSYLNNANIIIIVYSVDNRASFEDLDKWLQKVNEVNDRKDYVLGIAGNKCDLLETQISEDEGRDYAKNNNAFFSLISAKEKIGIKEFIDNLVIQYDKGSKLGDFGKNLQLTGKNTKKSNKCC